MNVFLDSNILYKDYFFENKSNKALLAYCKRELINLYLSDIVLLELRRQFEKELDLKNTDIRKTNKDCKRLGISTTYEEVHINKHLSKFDDFYKILLRLSNFHKLSYRNDFLPDIVYKAINRKRPFTEEKTELKDALIWKTYADYVEKTDLNDCILLTNNTSDFCDSRDKQKIHPDLLKDTNKFTLINNSFSFIKEKATILESPDYQFQIYIDQIEIDNIFALFTIKNTFAKHIREAVIDHTNSLHPSDVLKQYYIFDGHVIGHEVDISECEEVEFDVLSSKALISGKLFVDCESEVFEYNANRDFGEDSHTAVADKYITYIIGFNFDLLLDGVCENFEITDLGIYTID